MLAPTFIPKSSKANTSQQARRTIKQIYIKQVTSSMANVQLAVAAQVPRLKSTLLNQKLLLPEVFKIIFTVVEQAIARTRLFWRSWFCMLNVFVLSKAFFSNSTTCSWDHATSRWSNIFGSKSLFFSICFSVEPTSFWSVSCFLPSRVPWPLQGQVGWIEVVATWPLAKHMISLPMAISLMLVCIHTRSHNEPGTCLLHVLILCCTPWGQQVNS